MTKILAVAGSLRRKSYNMALLRAAVDLAPDGTIVEVGSIGGIPLYDADLEASDGIPEAVSLLKEQIAASDGLLIATPEYNNSMPGVLKNAMDWLSRPPSDSARVFRNRPVGVIGASPGALGTVLGQTAWLAVWRALGARPWFGARLIVPGASHVFDDSGLLVDDDIRGRLKQYLQEFSAFIDQ